MIPQPYPLYATAREPDGSMGLYAVIGYQDDNGDPWVVPLGASHPALFQFPDGYTSIQFHARYEAAEETVIRGY